MTDLASGSAAAAHQRRFMSRAIRLSIENVRSGRGGPFAALIVKGRRVISEGTNRVTATNDPTAHAEIVAIRRACQTLGHHQLAGCDIYATCEPCPMCFGAIYWARASRVFFASTRKDAARIGFDDCLIYNQLRLPPRRRKIPMIRLMREEALVAFREWQGSELRVDY